mgnify:CR=1 FL=1
MASETFPPPVVSVDLESLLQPISEELPCGESLRYEGTYDKILEARRSERTDLPQGVWKTELKAAEWDEVEALCIEALTSKSKDIQIALWLTEAWMSRQGAGGFRHGLDLLHGLCTRFWPGLHPEIRDGDVEYRVAPFVWLAENLALGLNSVAITWPRSYDDLPRCTHGDWQAALRLEKLEVQAPEQYEYEIQNGRTNRERFELTATDSVPEVIVDTYGQFRAAAAALNAVDDVLDQQCGREAPSLRKAKTLLKDIINTYETVIIPAIGLTAKQVKAHGLPPKATAQARSDSPEAFVFEGDSADSVGDAVSALPAASDRLSGRAQAYRMLAEVADYLERVEPHSPTPYLIRRAVSWERMSLLELMAEILQNPGEVQNLAQLLGIPLSRDE